MFDHVGIRVSDREASRRFYTTVLGEPDGTFDAYEHWGEFDIAYDGEPAVTRGLHVAFYARSRGEVDEFWRRGVDAGYESDGEPGERPQYSDDYYGAFLLDPDGNSVEKVHHERRAGGSAFIDHLWIGVADLEAARAFWRTVAPVLALRFTTEEPERFHLAVGESSFGIVADGRPPTENVHLAFTVPTDDAVAEFHRVALAGGYRDNGAPGERPQYHPGYVGSFVLDPDRNNIEAVNHNR